MMKCWEPEPERLRTKLTILSLVRSSKVNSWTWKFVFLSTLIIGAGVTVSLPLESSEYLLKYSANWNGNEIVQFVTSLYTAIMRCYNHCLDHNRFLYAIGSLKGCIKQLSSMKPITSAASIVADIKMILTCGAVSRSCLITMNRKSMSWLRSWTSSRIMCV